MGNQLQNQRLDYYGPLTPPPVQPAPIPGGGDFAALGPYTQQALGLAGITGNPQYPAIPQGPQQTPILDAGGRAGYDPGPGRYGDLLELQRRFGGLGGMGGFPSLGQPRSGRGGGGLLEMLRPL